MSKYKFFHQTLCDNDYNHTLSIDKHNGRNKRDESIKLGTDRQHHYDTCKSMGEGSSLKACEHIRAYFVFDTKNDGLYTARLVADGHLTVVALFGVYSGFFTPRRQTGSFSS